MRTTELNFKNKFECSFKKSSPHYERVRARENECIEARNDK